MLILAFGAAKTEAQTSNEFFSTSMASIPSGPTASPQTARLLLNSNNPAGDTIGATSINVSMTASISNQQYTGVNTGTGNPVVMFGANNATGSSTPASIPAFGAMNGVGGGTNAQFSNTPSGTAQGINVAVNNAFDIYTSVKQWAGTPPGAPATNSRVYMADLTLTFSSPVTNPRLHFVGMGGTSAGLGISSEFDLITPGLTLTKIQGSTDLVVTATQINNGASSIDASCSGFGADAGCGTVRVNGSNITTVTFLVYVRGDGGASSWGSTSNHAGDRWLLGVSLPESYNVSGNVFHDVDGSGTINGTGIGSPGGTQLYATVVDPTDNTVLGSVPVNPDGTFSFDGVPGGSVNYQVHISTIQGTALSPAPVRVLPSGWVSVGENNGAGAGNDGSADRELSVTVGSANSGNLNFGITTGPTAADVTIEGQIRTADGRGIRNIRLTLTLADGTTMNALTSSFGYYRFEGIPAGQAAVLSVRSKRFSFSNPVVLLDMGDNLTGIDFVSEN